MTIFVVSLLPPALDLLLLPILSSIRKRELSSMDSNQGHARASSYRRWYFNHIFADFSLGMLDFDFICKRTTPSVAGIIYPFGGQFVSKM